MAGKMNQGYFDKKRDAAADEVLACIQHADEALGLISSVNYQFPDLVSPRAVHDALIRAARCTEIARYHFEKARWAAASTSASLGEWLKENDCVELIRFGD